MEVALVSAIGRAVQDVQVCMKRQGLLRPPISGHSHQKVASPRITRPFFLPRGAFSLPGGDIGTRQLPEPH